MHNLGRRPFNLRQARTETPEPSAVARGVRQGSLEMPPSSPEPTPEDALEQRAQELEALRQAEHETAFSGDQREMTGEISLVGQHPADVSDFTYQRELQQTTQDLLEREAQQVQAAVRARERGSYGVCEECGQQIPAERLQARPEATLCVECQRQLETRRPG
jgi:phage/conjugal plasmid C-4 type zinc finger TraR family protein